MSTKRRLITRDRHSLIQQTASPGNAARKSATAPESSPLPSYQIPRCPLTTDGKRHLQLVFSGRETQKYEAHLRAVISTITNAATEANDRLVARRDHLDHVERKRRKLEAEGEGKEEETKARVKEEESERSFVNVLEKKVDKLTVQTETAVRELIDCQEEIVAQRVILEEISENVAAAAPGRRHRRRVTGEEEGDEGDKETEMAPAEDAEIMSALELMQEKKENYKRKWEGQSLHQRYAQNGEYVTYKRVVHDSMFPQDSAPPLSKTTSWFKDGLPEAPAATRRRVQGSQAGEDELEGFDDEPVITAQTQSFRDPISMAIIVNPVTSTVCKHTYEKANIIEHICSEGQQYGDAGMGRNRARLGPKQVHCPTVGCEAMVEEKDLYDDKVFKRKLERAQKKEAQGEEAEEEEEEDDDAVEI